MFQGIHQAMILSCAGTVLMMAGCSGMETLPSGKSLYDRLGGKSAVTAVVDQFVANVMNDTRINGRFALTDITKMKGHFVDQVCVATGGPCKYTGREMKALHAGMKITEGEFSALVGDLVPALDKVKVPAEEKNELLGLLGRMKKDIVE